MYIKNYEPSGLNKPKNKFKILTKEHIKLQKKIRIMTKTLKRGT